MCYICTYAVKKSNWRLVMSFRYHIIRMKKDKPDTLMLQKGEFSFVLDRDPAETLPFMSLKETLEYATRLSPPEDNTEDYCVIRYESNPIKDTNKTEIVIHNLYNFPDINSGSHGWSD